MKKYILISILGLLLTACGGNSGTANPANTANATTNSNPANTATNANSNPANTVTNTNANSASNVNKPANTTAAKPAPTGPIRVSFKKGEINSTQNIDLAPGASVQFALGATGNQTVFVTPKSDGLNFKMLKMGYEFTKMDNGNYMSVTKGNNGVKGDVIFEVKNPTTKAIKTSIRIEIQDVGD